jgi:hypothetical protein
MPYKANRGGHAPGHLRGAFCEFVDEWYAAKEGEEVDTVAIDDEPRPVKWLFGQLWNCSDCMPGELVQQINDMLEVHHHSELHRYSYASGVRAIAALNV